MLADLFFGLVEVTASYCTIKAIRMHRYAMAALGVIATTAGILVTR